MPRKNRPQQIAPGIFRDGDRLVARVRVGGSRNGQQQIKRETFSLETPIKKIIAWQHGAKQELLDAAPAPVVRGSLAADVDAWILKLPIGKYRDDTRQVLKHWQVSDVGAKPRHEITRDDILTQRNRWTDAGVAPATINRRVSRLRAMFNYLDGGPAVPHPTDKITKLAEPEAEAREIQPLIVKAILDSIVDHGRPERDGTRPDFSVTKIRLRVMAWIGHGQATIRRIRPRDLDLNRARLYLRPRRKGKGTEYGTWVGLLPEAIDALRDFKNARILVDGKERIGLFGLAWSNSSTGKSWRVAIKRATESARRVADETGDRSWLDGFDALPARCKPYDLRHSLASEVLRRTGDLTAVKEILQHAELDTTLRYARNAVSDRVAKAIEIAGTTFAAVPKLPAPAPAKQTRRLRLVAAK